jgi:hypothetical protein
MKVDGYDASPPALAALMLSAGRVSKGGDIRILPRGPVVARLERGNFYGATWRAIAVNPFAFKTKNFRRKVDAVNYAVQAWKEFAQLAAQGDRK